MKPANGRHRPLLALPVVGTGDGGGWAVAGEIVKRLVSVLLDVVQTVNADVVIVTRTDDQFAAVQQARRTIQRERHIDPWPALSGRVRDEGDRLAAFARDGQLVLFLGAGVSVGAGLPTWNGLLDRLATRAELTDDERTALRNLPVLDQAHIIRDRLERGPNGERHDGALADAIVAETTQEHYGLAHALLASLPIRESVTTNYDTLFEGASGAAGYKTATLPYESTAGAARWLLKMHGCVKRPQDIVLTREDFLRYVNQRSALAGIVQALLITRHMLFVGFSLTDDNFLRIADEVRRVVRLPRPGASSAPPAPFGTALLLSHSQLLPSLWTGDITCVSMTEAPVASDATDDEKHAVNAKAANDLEILLDYILAASSQNSAHLLDERYKALLSEDERALRQMLKELVHSADRQTGVRTLPAWKPIEALLQALGGAGKP